jgi:hypothetical protein
VLDQVGIVFLEGAPIITELSFLRVSEYNWDLETGCKFALGNLVLYNVKLHWSVHVCSCLHCGFEDGLLILSSLLNIQLTISNHDFPHTMSCKDTVGVRRLSENDPNLLLQFVVNILSIVGANILYKIFP